MIWLLNMSERMCCEKDLAVMADNFVTSLLNKPSVRCFDLFLRTLNMYLIRVKQAQFSGQFFLREQAGGALTLPCLCFEHYFFSQQYIISTCFTTVKSTAYVLIFGRNLEQLAQILFPFFSFKVAGDGNDIQRENKLAFQFNVCDTSLMYLQYLRNIFFIF